MKYLKFFLGAVGFMLAIVGWTCGITAIAALHLTNATSVLAIVIWMAGVITAIKWLVERDW